MVTTIDRAITQQAMRLLRPTPTDGQCSGCVDCCVIFGLRVPAFKGGGMEEKPPLEPCWWLGWLDNGKLGCRLHGERKQPAICRAYRCEPLWRAVRT